MVRGRLPLAGLLAALTLTACGKKQPANAQASVQASAAPNQHPDNAVLEGEWLYENNCAECHENPHPDLHKQPPNLHGVFRRRSLPSGVPATAAQIRATVIEGRGTMPAFDQRLREVDVDNLITYLRKLK